MIGNRIVWSAAAVLAALPVLPLAGQTVGINAAVRNDVKLRQTAEAADKKAVRGEEVRLGNLFTTGKMSSVQIALRDNTTITVGPNARLTVNRFVYDPARRSSSVGAQVTKGTFRFLTGKPARGGRNSVDTPAATIGIRGTMFEGAVGEDALDIVSVQPGFVMPAGVDPESATLVVLRGPGPNVVPGEKRGEISVSAGGETVELNLPGEAVFIPAAGSRPIRFMLANPAFEPFDDRLRTAPDRYRHAAAALLLGEGDTPSAVPSQSGTATPDEPVGRARPARRMGFMTTLALFAGMSAIAITDAHLRPISR